MTWFLFIMLILLHLILSGVAFGMFLYVSKYWLKVVDDFPYVVACFFLPLSCIVFFGAMVLVNKWEERK